MREENMVNKNDNNVDNPNDVLALLQDYTEKETMSNDMDESFNMGQGLLDDMEFDNTDDDLLALLDMITEQDQTETPEIYALEEEEQSFEEEQAYEEGLTFEEESTYKNEDSNDDILALNDLWDNDLDLALDESFSDEPDYGDLNYGDSSHLGNIFSDVLSAVRPEKEINTDNINRTSKLVPDETMATAEKVKALKKKSIFSELFNDEENNLELEESDIKGKTSKKKKEAKIKKQSTGTKKEKKKASSKKEKKDIVHKPAKVKKEKNKAGAKIIKEVDTNEKPLNKKLLVGLSVLMISFGIFIVFGTRSYTEALSISNATTNFERKRYTEAYNELYGMSRNNRNKDIYDKVMTVMYVNKHLSTYNNYYSLELYPQALDSLIKGLQRYDQYIEQAANLGIESDLDNIKSSILKELDTKFNVYEKSAVKLAKVDDKKQYSENVYTIVANSKK